MEPGDDLSVVGGDAGDRHPDRRLQHLSARRRSRAASPYRAGSARPRRRFPARDAIAAARAETVLLAARRGTLGRDPQSRSACRSGSTRSAAPRSWKSASSSTIRSCGYSRGAPTSTISNSWIFLVWMVATSLVVLAVAILFLRNQIRPIVRLADAAEAFGKGREAPNFRPRGAREVRRAAAAFLEMKARIERAIEQRTTMLAGVSHDLRTILTRFKLELALLGDSPEDRRDEEGRRRDGGDARGLSRLCPRRYGRAIGADRHGRHCSRS